MTTERDIRNQIAFAHDKGVEEGLEAGRAEGREEASKAVARKLKAEGVSVDMISRVTGLTEEQILAL